MPKSLPRCHHVLVSSGWVSASGCLRPGASRSSGPFIAWRPFVQMEAESIHAIHPPRSVKGPKDSFPSSTIFDEIMIVNDFSSLIQTEICPDTGTWDHDDTTQLMAAPALLDIINLLKTLITLNMLVPVNIIHSSEHLIL